MEFGSHEVQKIIMIVLLVATGALALLCDYMRIRMTRASVPQQAPAPAPSFEPRHPAIAHTLVPDIEIPEAPIPEAQMSHRAQRLAAALRQPRRLVSADVLAVLERGSQDDSTAANGPVPSQKKSKTRRAS